MAAVVVEVAEAFLAAEAVSRGKAAISREVKEAFPEAAAVSLVMAILLIPEAFLAAAAAVSPETQTVFQVADAELFPGAVALALVETMPGPLDITA